MFLQKKMDKTGSEEIRNYLQKFLLHVENARLRKRMNGVPKANEYIKVT